MELFIHERAAAEGTHRPEKEELPMRRRLSNNKEGKKNSAVKRQEDNVRPVRTLRRKKKLRWTIHNLAQGKSRGKKKA